MSLYYRLFTKNYVQVKGNPMKTTYKQLIGKTSLHNYYRSR
jgi:hypothetical protein